MKVKAPPRMSSIQWFVSIAAGLAMFLLPQDVRAIFPMFTARFCGRGCLRHSACPFGFCSSCTSDRRGDAVLHVSHSNYVCNPDWNQDL